MSRLTSEQLAELNEVVKDARANLMFYISYEMESLSNIASELHEQDSDESRFALAGILHRLNQLSCAVMGGLHSIHDETGYETFDSLWHIAKCSAPDRAVIEAEKRLVQHHRAAHRTSHQDSDRSHSTQAEVTA